MEKYSKTCRFILSVNYSSKIISRSSHVVRYSASGRCAEDVRNYLRHIASLENLTIADDALEALVHVSQGI